MFKKLLLKWCSRVPKDNYDFTNIKSVIIRPFFRIGDCVIQTAAIAQLKDYYPDIKVGVLVTDYNRGVFENCPMVDEVIPYKFLSSFTQRKKWQVMLDYPGRTTSFGLIFDKILAPDYVMCFEKDYKKYYNVDTLHNYDVYCHKIPSLHFSKWLGITPIDFIVKEPIRYCLRNFADDENVYSHERSRKLNILLCAEGSDRGLPLKLVVGLLTKLNKPQYRFTLLNTGGSGGYYKELGNIHGLDVELAHKTDFTGFLKYIYFADAVITLDTAAVHIACAYKIPMLTLYAHDLGIFKVLDYENCKIIMPTDKSGKAHDYSVFTVDDIYPKADALLKKLLGISSRLQQ